MLSVIFLVVISVKAKRELSKVIMEQEENAIIVPKVIDFGREDI